MGLLGFCGLMCHCSSCADILLLLLLLLLLLPPP